MKTAFDSDFSVSPSNSVSISITFVNHQPNHMCALDLDIDIDDRKQMHWMRAWAKQMHQFGTGCLTSSHITFRSFFLWQIGWFSATVTPWNQGQDIVNVFASLLTNALPQTNWFESLFFHLLLDFRYFNAFYLSSSLCRMSTVFKSLLFCCFCWLLVALRAHRQCSLYSLLIRPLILRNDLLIFAIGQRIFNEDRYSDTRNKEKQKKQCYCFGFRAHYTEQCVRARACFLIHFDLCSSVCTSRWDQWTIAAKRLNGYSCNPQFSIIFSLIWHPLAWHQYYATLSWSHIRPEKRKPDAHHELQSLKCILLNSNANPMNCSQTPIHVRNNVFQRYLQL